MDQFENDSDDSVELSSEHITAALDSLTNICHPDVNMAINMNGTDIDKPHRDAFLTIIEQPQSRGFRFRYKCEGPSHGGLQGVKSEKGKKSYPTVQVMNYEGPARILVSLVTDDNIPKTHAHELVGKSCNKGICLMDVKEAKNPICQFQNIGVMHVTKRKVADVLKERILESMLLNKRICSGNVNDENIQLNDTEKENAKSQADTQAKSMHLNVVKLCFQAYLQDKNGNLTIMLPSVISTPIYDSKSPGAAALKICRMDKCGGCCTGNEEVFLLCEKVQKDDIKVLFIEMDQDQKIIWKKDASFGPTDVHKQYAIVFKTPEYRNVNIKDPVKVFIKLERPSDEEFSEPKVFTYYPQNPDEDGIEKKRRKLLPRIPNSDNLFENFNCPPSMGMTHFPEINDPMIEFSNGGTDNTNYTSHSFLSEYIGDSGHNFLPEQIVPGIDNTNYASHSFLPEQISDSDSYINQNLLPLSDFKMSFEATNDDESNDLEVDSVPCNTQTLHPYTPVLYNKAQGPLKKDLIIDPIKEEKRDLKKDPIKEEKRDLKKDPIKEEKKDLKKDPIKEEKRDLKKDPIKEEKKDLKKDPIKEEKRDLKKDPIKEEKRDLKIKCKTENKSSTENSTCLVKKEVESGNEMNILPADIKTEHIDTKECAALSNKLSPQLDLLMAFRDFSITGSTKYLLMKNRNLIMIPNKYGDNCLHLALINNQSEVVRNLVPVIAATVEDLNISNHRFQTGLHLAVLTNQPDMVELLLKQGIKRTLVDCNGNTAAHLAVKYNYMECLKSLLRLDTGKYSQSDPFPEVDMLNCDGFSPLHLACIKGSIDCVRLLIESKAEVNLPDGKSGRTPLHIAVEKNDLIVAAELLLEAECDTSCVTFDGNTPLHLACGRDYDTMVALLLSMDADPEATSGMTDWCISDVCKYENSTDEDQLLDDMKGTKPRDLVYNNEKILRLLNGEAYSKIPGSNTTVNECIEGDLCQLSDEMRQNLVNMIDSANGIENWKSLAKLLNIEYLIDEANKSTGSPTLCILDMYEMLGGHLKDLHSAFMKLEMKDAAWLLNDVMG